MEREFGKNTQAQIGTEGCPEVDGTSQLKNLGEHRKSLISWKDKFLENTDSGN